MILSIVKNREWTLRYCLFDRKCYFTGESLRFKPCYLGRKKIKNIVNPNYENDDIWISKKEYINMIKKGVV